MSEREYFLPASDGTSLYFHEWTPHEEPRALVCLVHGLGDHSGRFQPLTDFFLSRSVAVLAVDLHGNGRSDGPRGHVHSYETFMRDIDLLLEEAAARFPNYSPFLYGHSLGGNLVLNYVLRRGPQLSGCIASSPWLGLASSSRKLVAAARFISLFRPCFTIDAGINPRVLSHDVAFIDSYASDPLVHGRVSAGLLAKAIAAAGWALGHARQLSVPTLVMHSPDDSLTSFETSKKFVERAGSSLCQLKDWPGAFHSLHNEVNRGEVFTFVMAWMEEVGRNGNT